MTVDAKFVDDLRELSHEELSERLNSEDTEVRVKAAADIKCMVALLTNLLNSTSAFHKELRRLLIGSKMKSMFDGSTDEREGRNRVNQFLRRRLNSMYPGLSHEERAEIDKMSQVIMEGKGEEEGEDRAKRVYRV
ncbi:MAG TPA: hypothetical protein DIC52_11015 [Candidatus Latescibacteria bacterium]|nr:hypothetical protein [Candidatus Latescibacterota bacterium]